ncbi:mevalonate kinase [Allofustis seminis]|uniref:mevalonate kinase n=1 Tax=Allofustis seminis TaxID=166939 RepID=UPI000377B025|nr:mevalonate kinase [Allofustis seminis]
MNIQHGIGTAHGKIILIGEHAVVYGAPALALPLQDLTIRVEITPDKDFTTLHSKYFNGKLHEAPSDLDNLKAILHHFMNDHPEFSKPLCITIDNTLPSERGMGSSAAVATALVRALFDYFALPLSEEELDEYVDIAEKIAHGNPSGVDALIVKNDMPFLFKKNTYAKKITLHMPGYLVIADTGQVGQTRGAVAGVAEYRKENIQKFEKEFEEILALIEHTLSAINEKDLEALGMAMNETQDILRNWTVSNEKLDELTSAALKAGAIGAKLTGSGRGGCMIALASNFEKAEEIAHTLEQSGAVSTWIHSLNR